MIELMDGRTVYVLTTSVRKWAIDDVCKWVSKIARSSFVSYVETFRMMQIDGETLLNLNDGLLNIQMNISDQDMRVAFLREIRLLKKQVL